MWSFPLWHLWVQPVDIYSVLWGRGACGVRRVGMCPVPGVTFICTICSLQGVVCTLHEGDDFGKLALVNDAPRAASIVLREDNCHFLRVDKEDFNRILRVSLRCRVAEGLPVATFAWWVKDRSSTVTDECSRAKEPCLQTCYVQRAGVGSGVQRWYSSKAVNMSHCPGPDNPAHTWTSSWALKHRDALAKYHSLRHLSLLS